MSWMSVLYETYENNIGLPDEDSKISLIPVAHMMSSVHIEIVLNQDALFCDAKVLPKGEKIFIPVTERSAGRTAGVWPHPLNDQLAYIAGDFAEYARKGTERKKSREKFKKYIAQLKEWNESKYSCNAVDLIYRYLLKENLCKDLIQTGILKLDTDGKRIADEKINGQSYERLIVRFVVKEPSGRNETWNDKKLRESFTQYYLDTADGKEDICYLTGKKTRVASIHPKGVLQNDYNAKLISANDTHGFTYRGLFHTADQAFTLGYEATQKIHNTLTWLIQKQGVTIGTKERRTFICWCPKNGKDMMKYISSGINNEINHSDLNDVSNDKEPLDLTETRYKARLFEFLTGRKKMDADGNVVLMGLEAATPGRLSITEYNEYTIAEFWTRIGTWYEECYWEFFSSVRTPSIYEVVNCAYGKMEGNTLKTNDKVLKLQTQRLMNCILNGSRIPLELMMSLTRNASVLQKYDNKKCRSLVLSTACAVIMKYHKERGYRIEMELDKTNTDRNYLFGRLLAVYDAMEFLTYTDEKSRDTNAIRHQTAFVNRPLQTWKILEMKILPYKRKLSPSLRCYYEKTINEIVQALPEMSEQELGKPLNSMYLLGYYAQRTAKTTEE